MYLEDLLEEHEWRFFHAAGNVGLPRSKRAFKEALPEVIAEIEDIVGLAQESQKGRSVPLLRPKSYLSRTVYMLTFHAEELGFEDILRQFLTKRVENLGGRVHKNNRNIGSNDIIHLCFRALRIEGLPIRGGELTRLSRGLRVATDNEVPPEYLIGYLYQTAGFRSLPKTPQQQHEEDEEWGSYSDISRYEDEDGWGTGEDDDDDWGE
jgi:hypothetical protein